MASLAYIQHLVPLLDDSDHLLDIVSQLQPGIAGHPQMIEAINRAVVVTAVSAWEAYIEELVRECLDRLRPPPPHLGVWPALNASVRGQLGRFNTPNTDNIRMLVSDAVGLQDVQTSWSWQNYTSDQAVLDLARAMSLRHQLAHGVNPRPIVETHYSSQLPDFFRQLGRCTDHAVREHLVNVLGIANPWSP